MERTSNKRTVNRLNRQGSQPGVKPFLIAKSHLYLTCKQKFVVEEFENKSRWLRNDCKRCKKLLDFYKYMGMEKRRDTVRRNLHRELLNDHRMVMDCYEDVYV